ncbi:hypothetical protein [Nocardiopsis eucommiae]|uniref:hypothetical protein n=1 Tax=Nocardiopsis eucommiae TaxID=2831970 RepID=UPI003D7272BD
MPSPLVHRAVLPVRTNGSDIDVLAIVRRRLAAWIESKYPASPLPVGSGTHHLTDQATVTLSSAYREDGTEQGMRARLREENPSGVWVSTVTSVVSDQAWVGVELEHLPASEPGWNRPRLIGELVEELPVWDGPARLTCNPQVVTMDRVESLLAVLTSVDRRYPAVVAARPSEPDERWSSRLRATLRQITGSASLYLLDSPQVCTAIREQLGPDYSVGPGAVRTYLADVDPAWPADGHRHRVLSPARMRDASDRAWKVVAHGVQGHARTHPLPPQLRSVPFRDAADTARREREQALAQARASTEQSTAAMEALRGEVVVMEGLLTEASTEIDQLQERAQLAEESLASMSEHSERLERGIEVELADHLTSLEELSQARDEIEALRVRLLQLGRGEEAYQPVPVTRYPSTFEELLEMLPHVDGVLFTGDRQVCLELDGVAGAKRAVWARKTWEALRSLDSYAQVKKACGFAGSFYDFCQWPPEGGRPWPVKAVAMVESDQVRARWAHERTFPVPLEVDPSGRSLMEAHLKIDSRGSVSPRVHFQDATEVVGQVLVGFIGRHLTNTRT